MDVPQGMSSAVSVVPIFLAQRGSGCSRRYISKASEESGPKSRFPTTQLMAVKVRARSGCEERATDTERSASLPHAVGQVRCERALHTRRAVHGQYRSRHIVYCRASKSDCSQSSLKPKCTTATVRKIIRDLNEDVRDRPWPARKPSISPAVSAISAVPV